MNGKTFKSLWPFRLRNARIIRANRERLSLRIDNNDSVAVQSLSLQIWLCIFRAESVRVSGMTLMHRHQQRQVSLPWIWPIINVFCKIHFGCMCCFTTVGPQFSVVDENLCTFFRISVVDVLVLSFLCRLCYAALWKHCPCCEFHFGLYYFDDAQKKTIN